MGHATLWPVPRAVDAEAHHYPRHWKRNMFFLYGGAGLIVLQIWRYGFICRVSIIQQDFANQFITFYLYSNLLLRMENTWTGAHGMPQRE